MTEHTCGSLLDTLHRYQSVRDKVAEGPLFEYLPRHLMVSHGLDLWSAEYTNALRLHVAVLGEGEGDPELISALAALRSQANESDVLPHGRLVFDSRATGGVIK